MPDVRHAAAAHPGDMVLLLHPTQAPADAYVAQPVRLRDRLAARLRARRLDRSLAHGDDPESGAALALRAATLTGPRRRRALAVTLERIAAAAGETRPRHRARPPETRSAVATLAPQLRALAGHLAQPGPVAARGVAEVALLLTDGASPLHASRGDLRGAVERATRHLELA
jgi:hypothetical protein